MQLPLCGVYTYVLSNVVYEWNIKDFFSTWRKLIPKHKEQKCKSYYLTKKYIFIFQL